jgi:hypothetical protein
MVSADRNDSVPRSIRSSEQDCAAKVLDLVHQAAELFRNMEDQARDVEARAESMRRSAAEKLKQCRKTNRVR